MKYLYRQHPSKISTLMIYVNAGARQEFYNGHPQGIAHLMEHMRFKGTRNYTEQALCEYAGMIGADWNAYTDNDGVAYHISFAEEFAEDAFKIIAEVLFNPVFPQEELEKEREVVCQEIRMYEEDLDDQVFQKLFNVVFGNTPLNYRVCGTEKSVKAITREDLFKFDALHYQDKGLVGDGVLMLFCGAKDHPELVDKYFGKPESCIDQARPNIYPVKPGGSFKVHKKGQLQRSILIGYANDFIQKPLASQAVCAVFNCIFGSGETSRLFKKVRQDHGLVYGIGAGLMRTMDGAVYTISTQTEPENEKEVLDLIDQEIKLITCELPTDREMTIAKNRIKADVLFEQDSTSDVVDQMLDEVVWDHPSVEDFLAEVKTITPDQVRDFAKLVLDANKYTVVGGDFGKKWGIW